MALDWVGHDRSAGRTTYEAVTYDGMWQVRPGVLGGEPSLHYGAFGRHGVPMLREIGRFATQAEAMVFAESWEAGPEPRPLADIIAASGFKHYLDNPPLWQRKVGSALFQLMVRDDGCYLSRETDGMSHPISGLFAPEEPGRSRPSRCVGHQIAAMDLQAALAAFSIRAARRTRAAAPVTMEEFTQWWADREAAPASVAELADALGGTEVAAPPRMR